MEQEIFAALNMQTTLLKQLISRVIKLEDLVIKLEKKKFIEELGWYNTERAMEALDVGKKTLYRMRKSHPDYCKKHMGQWYYNINVLDFNPKD